VSEPVSLPEPSAWRLPPFLVALAGWLVPGLGHLLLRRPGRACIYLLCVGSMIGLGLALGGHIFRLPARGVFEWLGVTANAGTGAFYFLSGMWGGWVSDVSRTAGDYGTRFLAAAGVLNLLFVLDAHEIASRRQR
jgi:TM2 domain-containing membrane protein YozV